MSYITTGSNNTVTNNALLNLKIKIIKDSLEEISLLDGRFTIECLDRIAKKEELKNVICTLYGKTKDDKIETERVKIFDKLKYDANNPGKQSRNLPKKYKDKYNYLDLEITGATCTIDSEEVELKITFWDKKDVDASEEEIFNTINFKVQNEQEKPEIIAFTANPTVIKANEDFARLSWRIKGNNYNYTLKNGLEVLYVGENNGVKIETIETPALKSGDHTFTLEVTQGKSTITRSVLVRALGTSKSSTDANPSTELVIGNFCVSQDSEYLFSVMLNDSKDGKGTLEYLGYTNEGFSGNWSKHLLSQADKITLKPFVNSPMVHLKTGDDFYGRLVFIGGGYVNGPESNTVAIVNLDEEGESKVQLALNRPWESRIGHSCTLFCHANETKIWLLGGEDADGNALNDVWVSGNGKDWINVDKTGALNNGDEPVEMEWSPRCLAGIAVEVDVEKNKKALWFGGGFDEIDGAVMTDVWKFENNKWSKINGLEVNGGKPYLSSGLAFIGKDKPQATGMCLIGGYKEKIENTVTEKRYFHKINVQNGNHSISQLGDPSLVEGFETVKEAYVKTAYFKGCLWFLVYTDMGDLGINYSKLYYWVPPVTGQTLILS